MANERRPVAAIGEGDIPLLVVCDDGSVWRARWGGEEFHDIFGWDEIVPIPGSVRNLAEAKRRERVGPE